MADPYCTVDDVQTLNQEFTYSTSTKPTKAQVEQWIGQIAAEINGVLRALGYTVPVVSEDSPEATEWLEHVNTVGAAAWAEQAASARSLAAGVTSHAANLFDEYRRKLEDLRDGRLLLDFVSGGDALVAPMAHAPESDMTDSTLGLDETSDVDVGPDFAIDRAMEQF